MTTRRDAILTLRAAGRENDAREIEAWKNVLGNAGGWDAWLLRMDPECAAFVGLTGGAKSSASPAATRRAHVRTEERSSDPVAREPFLRAGVPLARLPDRIFHADWSTDPKGGKRQLVSGSHQGHGFQIDAPEPCGAGEALLERLLTHARAGESVLVGFDFAIGVPLAYAHAAHEGGFSAQSFLDLLVKADREMFEPHDTPDVLSWRRPFFPRSNAGWASLAKTAAPGRQHQAIAEKILGPSGTPTALLRIAERRHELRTDASPLFLLGHGKQVGKASLSGWREILLPALRHHRDRVRIWPYDGPLATCVEPGVVTIVETYPGESYAHLGIRGNNKRDCSFRAAASRRALEVAAARAVTTTDVLARLATDGFGEGNRGEDQFDAMIGALAIALVVLGHDLEGRAPNDDVLRWEGWILGRPER